MRWRAWPSSQSWAFFSAALVASGRSSRNANGMIISKNSMRTNRMTPMISPLQGFWTLLSGSFSAVSASALWVNFDGHETVTVTMDHLPGAILSPVDRRRPQPHFLRLTVDTPSEPLNLDCETECTVETGDEVLRAPGFVVERLGCCGQELAHLVNTDLMTANPSHERNVVSMRPQFKKRPRVTAGVLPQGVMTPLEELGELGSVCIRPTCRRLHNFSSSCRNSVGLDPFCSYLSLPVAGRAPDQLRGSVRHRQADRHGWRR